MSQNPNTSKSSRYCSVAIAGAVVLALWAFPGCKDQFPTDADDIVFPESNVSFSRHVEAVFRARCIACHSGSTAPEGLDLSTPAYSNLMNHIPRLVIAGDPDNSLLVWRIEGQGGLARMPFGQPPLTQNQITGIRTWISEGGVNN